MHHRSSGIFPQSSKTSLLELGTAILMAQTPIFLLLSSRAPILLEYSPEVGQERKALRWKSVEAIEIFDVGKIIT